MKLTTLRIKHIMLDKNMSRADLAEAAKISYQRTCSYLTGYCIPSLNTLGKIARALGVSVADIIED